MEAEGERNLYDVPLMALRASTRQIIINELNKKKVLASEEGLPRDWRGLAHLTGLSSPLGDSPTTSLITSWERESSASLGLLKHYLGQLDRWDIIDDITLLLREDAKDFSTRITDSSTNNSLEVVSETDSRVLTYDDIVKLEHGLEPQMYDALLLYADEDQYFARQMVDRLENDYCLKVCLKENLVGGLSFEHQGIMRLISERCRRVIIIVSHSFVNSPVNRFFVTFAQALAIEQRRRIIIPCMYERDRINLPMEINYLHKLDYNRVGLRHYDFWEMLRLSVTSAPAVRHSPVAIREINTQEQPPAAQKAIEPPELQVTKPCELKMAESPKLAKAMKCSSNLPTPTQNVCSSTLNLATQKFSYSSLSLPEKKHKTKSSTDFFRKLFRSDKQEKKNKKIAVRL